MLGCWKCWINITADNMGDLLRMLNIPKCNDLCHIKHYRQTHRWPYRTSNISFSEVNKIRCHLETRCWLQVWLVSLSFLTQKWPRFDLTWSFQCFKNKFINHVRSMRWHGRGENLPPYRFFGSERANNSRIYISYSNVHPYTLPLWYVNMSCKHFWRGPMIKS